MASKDNLQAAFAGESQANRKYTAYAQKAEQDGYPVIAKLFRAAADAETIHALTHFRVLGGVQATELNLEDAIKGERYEFQEMYPGFLKDAEGEGNQGAVATFKNANAVEEIHHGLYTEALASLKSGKDLPDKGIYVCPVCGNTVWGEAPEKCPICGVPHDKFFEVK
jgi:rubrerythrin